MYLAAPTDITDTTEEQDAFRRRLVDFERVPQLEIHATLREVGFLLYAKPDGAQMVWAPRGDVITWTRNRIRP